MGSGTTELQALLDAATEQAAPIIQAVDDLIVSDNPSVVRVVWLKQSAVGYGVGPRKMTDHYAYIAVYGDVVNLGFNYGALLEDPDDLLDGVGARFRKRRIRSPRDVDDPALRGLVERAREERERARL